MTGNPMNELIQEFLNYITVERGLSRNTIEAYARDLRQFAALFHSQQRSKGLCCR